MNRTHYSLLQSTSEFTTCKEALKSQRSSFAKAYSHDLRRVAGNLPHLQLVFPSFSVSITLFLFDVNVIIIITLVIGGVVKNSASLYAIYKVLTISKN